MRSAAPRSSSAPRGSPCSRHEDADVLEQEREAPSIVEAAVGLEARGEQRSGLIALPQRPVDVREGVTGDGQHLRIADLRQPSDRLGTEVPRGIEATFLEVDDRDVVERVRDPPAVPELAMDRQRLLVERA